MATRFYLSSSTAAAVSPAFGSYDRTSDADRMNMSPTKDGSAITDKTFWGNTNPTANQSCLARQFVSDQMPAGIVFTSGDAYKAVIQCRESSTNDNIASMKILVRVYSDDGSTLRATLSSALSGANEWSGSRTNRMISTTLSAGYTTVANDRLVLDVGGQVDATGGTGVTGTMRFGSAAGTDLAENETDIGAFDPWFEIAVDCFAVAAAGQPTSKRFGGVPFMGAHGSGLQAPVRQWMRRASGLMTPQTTTRIWRPANGVN